MSTELEEVLPQVILTERAAQVFKEACSAEGKSLENSYLRIGRPSRNFMSSRNSSVAVTLSKKFLEMANLRLI